MTPAQLKELRIYRDGGSLRMGGWRSPGNGRVAAALARMGYLERLDQSENVRGEGRAYWSEYRPVEAKLPEIQRLTEHIVMWEREAYYAKYPDAPRLGGVRPFGAETLDAKRAIERKLIADGAVPGSPELHFSIEHAWVEQNKGKPNFRERQEAARARGEKWVSPLPGPPMTRLALTDEEAAYLREKLAGVNDPVGAAVLAKIS